MGFGGKPCEPAASPATAERTINPSTPSFQGPSVDGPVSQPHLGYNQWQESDHQEGLLLVVTYGQVVVVVVTYGQVVVT